MPGGACSYNGSAIAGVSGGAYSTADGHALWQTLSATVWVPTATATQNGTALQVRITPKLFVGHGFGATVWVDGVVIKEETL